MPWYFPWSDSLKLKAYRYLLNRYFGFYFLDKLLLEQLDINLSQGKSSIRDVNLHSENLTSILSELSIPIEILNGFIKTVQFTIPWSSILTDISIIEINDVDLYVCTKEKQTNSHQNSIFSMSDSIRLAEDYLKTEVPYQIGMEQTNFEGLEAFANTLDSILLRIKIIIKNINIYFVETTNGSPKAYFKLHINNLLFYDEKLNDPNLKDKTKDDNKLPQQKMNSTKKIINFDTYTLFSKLEQSNKFNDLDQSLDQNDIMNVDKFDKNTTKIIQENENFYPILISKRNTSLYLIMNQSLQLVEPKIEIQLMLGGFYAILQPHTLLRLVHLIYKVHQKSENLSTKHDSSPSTNNFISDHGLDDDPNDLYYFPNNVPAFIPSEIVTDNYSFYSLSPKSPSSLKQDHNTSEQNRKSSKPKQIYEHCSSYPSIYNHNNSTSNFKEASSYDENRGLGDYYNDRSVGRMAHGFGKSDKSSLCSSIEIRVEMMDLALIYDDSPGLNSDISKWLALYQSLGDDLAGVPDTALPHRDHLRFSVKGLSVNINTNHFPNHTTFWRALLQCESIIARETLYELAKPGPAAKVPVILFKIEAPKNEEGLHQSGIKIEFTEIISRGDQALDVHKSTPISQGPFTKHLVDAWMGCLYFDCDLTLYERLDVLVHLFKQRFSPSEDLLKKSTPSFQRSGLMRHSSVQTPFSYKPNINSKFECKVVIDELTTKLRFPKLDPQHNVKDKVGLVGNGRSNTQKTKLHREYLQLVIKHLYITNLIKETSPKLPGDCDYGNIEISFNEASLKLCDDQSPIAITPIVFVDSGNQNTASQQRPLPRIVIKRNRSLVSDCALQKSNHSTIYHSAREDELLLNLSKHGQEFIYSGLMGKNIGHYNHASTSNKLGKDQSQQHIDYHTYFGVGDEVLNDQNGQPPSGPSPFTRKRIMYENKRIINPGTKEEMLEFVNHFQTHSQYFVDVRVPNIVVCIESKSLYELLYTRLLNDLLMWTPYAPLSSPSPTLAHNRGKFNNQSMMGNQSDELNYEKYSEATIDPLIAHRFMSLRINIDQGRVVLNTLLPQPQRKAAKEEANSTKYSQFFVKFHNSYTLLTYTHEKHDNPHDVMVRVGHFEAYFAHTNCEAEGKAYGNFNLPGISEASTNAKPGLVQPVCHAAQPCFTLIRSKTPYANLHSSTQNQPSFTKEKNPDSNSFERHNYSEANKPFNSPKSFSYSPASLGRDYMLEDLDFELRDKRSVSGISKESGGCLIDAKSEERDDMLVLSSLSIFNRASGVKETTLSVSFNGALLDHRLAHHNEHWYSCMYEFFTLNEYAFSCAPLHRIDELYMIFNDCAIDYRPLYLPFKIYLDISSMCFSNLAFDMPRSSELKLLVEDSSVHLSNKADTIYADLKKDYVKVVSVGLFEVVIKRNYLSAKSHPDSPQNEDCFKGSPTEPQMEFRAINDALIISTCYDSCIALQNVLTYYALEGDLIETPSAPSTGDKSQENEPKTPSKVSLATSSHGCETYDSNFPSGAALKTTKCNQEEPPAISKLSLLMADAMNDADEPQELPKSKANNRVQSTAKTASPAETKIAAHNIKVKCSKNGRGKTSNSQQNTSVISSTQDSCHSFISTGSNSSYTNRSSKILQGEPKLSGVKVKKGLKSDPTDASSSSNVFRDPIDLNAREGRATYTNKSGTPPSNGSDDYAFIENTNKREHIIHKPETKWVCNLTPDQPVPPMVDNYFGVPEFSKYDQLKAPETFPTPLAKYLLNDITLVWELYGGHDFEEDNRTRHTSGKPASDAGNTPSPRTPRSSNQGTFFKAHKERRRRRNQDVLMQIHLNKIRFQHESYPPDSTQVSRQVLTIQEIQILDKLTSSRLNKFLYPYTSEASPRKSNAPMLLIKALHYKPDVEIQSQEECILKVSLQPIRLNMDQEALMFLRDFFQKVTSPAETEGVMDSSVTNSPNLNLSHKIATSGTSPVPSSPIIKVYQGDVSQSFHREASNSTEFSKESIFSPPYKLSEESNKSLNIDNPDSSHSPIFFRPVIFSPEVPIKLDYHGKYFDAGQGTLIGLLMALAQLDCSEIKLKKLSIRSGILGIDKVINYALKEWITDIKNNQLQGILSGIGPMHSFVQLAQGIKDLVYLPIEQYKKDRRIIKGLKRGASSFTSLSAVSTLDLSFKFVDFLKAAAETTYIMVSPDYEKIFNKQDLSSKPTRPFDIREGVASAYHLVKEGFGETAYDLIREASLEHRNKGLVGAMGSVIRNFPSTLVKPIVATAQATSTLLGGVKHQFVPEARKRALDKWKQPPMSY